MYKLKIDKRKLDIAMAIKSYSSLELSQCSGISQVTITRIKNGFQNPRPETVGKIARALNVNVEDLIMKEGD